MPEIIRFGVSLEKELLNKFDKFLGDKRYSNRSEAIRDLIREALVKEEWKKGGEVAGAVMLVYDHHKRELVNILLDIQHNYSDIIISTQHVHLDHNNCLEVIVAKGKTHKMQELYDRLRASKGVKYGALNMATTGKEIV